MTPHSDLPDLEQQRSRLHAGLAAVGDFRPGSLSAVMRRCGKPTCVCADPAHPGHGPQHILTKKVAGKTVAVDGAPDPIKARLLAHPLRARKSTTRVVQG